MPEEKVDFAKSRQITPTRGAANNITFLKENNCFI
jgi:hypothetical protein